LNLAEAEDYQRVMVIAEISLGYALVVSGTKSAAQSHLQRAIDMARSMRDRDLEADGWAGLANYFFWMRKPEKALDCAKRSLSLYQQAGNEVDRSITLSNMAYFAFSRARDFRSYESAVKYNQEALALARDLNYPYGELAALTGLGRMYLTAHLAQEATDASQEAVTLARKYGSKRYEQEAVAMLGNANYQLKLYDQALACFEQQIALAEDTKFSLWEIYAHYSIGNVYQKQKRYPEALAYWRKALRFEQELQGKPFYFKRALVGIYAAYFNVQMLFQKSPEPSP
jgi:tetratricopeptide (TPR) repeat protein